MSVDGIAAYSASITVEARTVDGGSNSLRGYPQLIGASRQSFLGHIHIRPGKQRDRQTTPKERGWATAAAVASKVLPLFAHGVLEMGDVMRVADAIWG